MGRHILMATAAGASILLLASAANAQSPAEGGAVADDTRVIPEIIVTATKRETKLQNTPISIQTYSRDDIVDRGVTDVLALSAVDSSVGVYMAGVPFISVRGVSSNVTTEVGDPAVSVGTDGVFLNRPYALQAGFYDLDRIEILRGPQGTLFGRNSTGGTVNVITAKPQFGQFKGQIVAEAGNYDLLAVQGFFNVPVSDTFAVRASYSVRRRDGYRDLFDVGLRGDDENSRAVRLQALYEPDDHLRLWLAAEYTKLGGIGTVSQQIPFIYSGAGPEPVHQFPATIGDGKAYPANGGIPYQDSQVYDLKWSATYSDLFDGVSLTYLGGYNVIDWMRGQPFLVPSPFAPGTFLPATTLDAHDKPKTLNQELRLSSTDNGSLTWQVGGYYFQEHSSVNSIIQSNRGRPGGFRIFGFEDPSVKTRSIAAFGQGTYAFTEKLKLTLGARYTWDNRSKIGTQQVYLAGIAVPQNGESQSSKLTWAVGLDYQATRDNLLYGKVSTGYKAGAFSFANDPTGAYYSIPYGPETVTSYELGSKNTFLDGKLQFNISAFYMDYRDQQVNQFLTGNVSGNIIVNAGKSRIYGFETNLVAVTGLGRLDVSFNYLNAKFQQFLIPQGWNPAVTADLSGNVVPYSPKFALSGRYEKEFDLFGGTLTPSASVKFESKKYLAAYNFRNQAQKAYATVDLGLDYALRDQGVSLGLYIKNLTDKTILTLADENYGLGFYQYSYQSPRTYGARLKYDF